MAGRHFDKSIPVFGDMPGQVWLVRLPISTPDAN
jgi:hypothetical protein